MKSNPLLLSTLFYGLILPLFLCGQNMPLTYYLPDIDYDESITTPQEFLGYQIGDWHISHDLLFAYARLVAEQSDRVELEVTGRTHENRPLCVLHISSPGNLKQKENIREQHLLLTDAENSDRVGLFDLPLVLYQGYSIHGNESSGANAAPLVLYYLAAGLSPEVDRLLNDVYILLDPCYNPDGVQRFSIWVNSKKGHRLISDPQSLEFNEGWPGSRTNHFLFDLNRDWLLLTHPESVSRIKTYHRWKPNILTDHHEMGTNSTFFFQPGVPSRTNPNTPWANQVLTEEIGRFHAAALDEIGSQYYTKSNFDDFYYGKGSTYPDIHGGIGILFEQASSRGHLQESDNGLLTFPFTIRNQVATSLSTQKAAVGMRQKILEYKRDFYQTKAREARENPVKAYIFRDADQQKMMRFAEILSLHDIEVHRPAKDVRKGERTYPAASSLIVPTEQKQYGLIKTIFEKVTSFQDSIFYDVSAWTMPLAFDLTYDELNKSELAGLGLERLDASALRTKGRLIRVDKPYAWIFEWKEHSAPKALYFLQDKGLLCKSFTQSIKLGAKGSARTFGPGSIVVPLHIQGRSVEQCRALMQSIADDMGIDVYEISSGYGLEGMTTGHPDVESLRKPAVFTLAGDGVSAYDVGELWHYMDIHLGIPITMMDADDVRRANLGKYNTLILADGSYRSLSDGAKEALSAWIKDGGLVIGMENAVSFMEGQKWIKMEYRKADEQQKIHTARAYSGASNQRGAGVLGGAIFGATLDTTHPLAYGYEDGYISLFRRGTRFAEPTDNAYATPLRYEAGDPIYSGYTPRGVREMAKGAAAGTVHGLSRGTLIAFADNLLFRGYWWGTHRLMANAVFFGPLISGSGKQTE